MRKIHVLFLCTANSSRSIMAEALLNELGGGRFQAYSAGSHPSGAVNRLAMETLARNGYSVAGLRSKSWDVFAKPGAPAMDFVITVCDSAAGEVCPIFPGGPVKAHWGVPDPAAVEGDDDAKRAAFRAALGVLRRRVQRFTSLPFESVDPRAMQALVREIAQG